MSGLDYSPESGREVTFYKYTSRPSPRSGSVQRSDPAHPRHKAKQVGQWHYRCPTFNIKNLLRPFASMRIYLDMCCLQRPMDDQTHLRIHIESEAILGVLAWCEAGNAELLNSVALDYEVDHNPHPARKAFVQEALLKTKQTVQASDSVEQRARLYCKDGVKVLDLFPTLLVRPIFLYNSVIYSTLQTIKPWPTNNSNNWTR